MSNTQLLIHQLQNVSTWGSLSTAYKLHTCNQLTKTLGSKRPAVDWLLVVYCSFVNFATMHLHTLLRMYTLQTVRPDILYVYNTTSNVMNSVIMQLLWHDCKAAVYINSAATLIGVPPDMRHWHTGVCHLIVEHIWNSGVVKNCCFIKARGATPPWWERWSLPATAFTLQGPDQLLGRTAIPLWNLVLYTHQSLQTQTISHTVE